MKIVRMKTQSLKITQKNEMSPVKKEDLSNKKSISFKIDE